MARCQGDYAAARALQGESLTIRRQLGNQQGIAGSLATLGMMAYYQGDYAAARALCVESLTLFRHLGDQRGIIASLDGMTIEAQGQSQPGRAARLGGASSSLRESIGSPRPPANQEEIDETLTSAREAPGDGAFTAAWDAGRAMTPEQAVEYALGGED